MRTVQLSINNSSINSMQHFKDKNCQKSKLLFMKLLFFLTLFILMFSSCNKKYKFKLLFNNWKGKNNWLSSLCQLCSSKPFIRSRFCCGNR